MSDRPRLAVITTVYRENSHSDVIVSRWLEPLPTDLEFGWPVGGRQQPRTEIVSMYIAQFPEVDKGRALAAQHGIPIFGTVREALTLGGSTLAVDGVLLIGEHGDYPHNELYQKMYPRRELFDEIVDVFRESGRVVPIFNDKHLSYDSVSALHMVDTARELGIPLMAGSSLPIAGCLEPWHLPEQVELSEGVGVFYGGQEAYGYHSIELLQSLVSERAGGESGIETVTAYHGKEFWKAEAEGVWSEELVEAALDQPHSIEPGDYRANLKAPRHVTPPNQWPAAFCFQHRDGLQTTHLLLGGHVKGFTVAAADKSGNIYSGCSSCNLNTADNFFAHFAQLNAAIEEFVLEGEPPYPIEHSLLCTLAINTAMQAMARAGTPIEMPQPELSYTL